MAGVGEGLDPASGALARAAALRFEEREPWERGFGAAFERELLPRLVMLEQRRWRAEASVARRRWLSTGALLGLGLGWWWLEGGFGVWGALTGLVALVIAGVWIGNPAESYRRTRKELVVTALADFLGDLTYAAEGPAPRAFWETSLFGVGQDGAVEDCVSGRVAGHPFQWCELRLTRSSGKSTHLVFRGWALSLDLRGGRGRWALLDAGDRRLAPGLIFGSPWTEGRLWTHASKQVWLRDGAGEPAAEVVEAIVAFERSVSPTRVQAVQCDGRLFVFGATRDDAFEPASIGVSSLDVADVRDLLRDLWQVRELARRLAGGVLGVDDR